MSPLANDTLLRALAREPTAYTPVWFMRQAGRYLPEYNATRARAGSFVALLRSADLCVEVALQPLERYRLDAAIVFSDILTIPDAMGLELSFAEGEGPRFAQPVREERAVMRLAPPDPSALGYVMEAVRATRRALAGRVPLIGFAGSPYTLACYMVEGAARDEFPTLKRMLYERPDLLHRILEVNTTAVASCLNAQIEAGAQAVMLFDTWGGNLTAEGYEVFSLAYSRKVFAALAREADGRHVPAILFTRGGGNWLEAMAASGWDAVGLDWTVDARQARARIGQRVALQGNLDPSALLAPPRCARAEARRVLEAFGPKPGHVFNLGHGISPLANPDSVAAVVEEVHTYSRRSPNGAGWVMHR